MIQMARSDLSLKALSKSINRPSITFVAIAVALALGAMQLPFLQYLRPIGDFYIALLKICVLPFFTLDNSFGSAFGHGQRIGRRNGQVAGYLGHSYIGGGRHRDGSRYGPDLSLHVCRRPYDRENRRIGRAVG